MNHSLPMRIRQGFQDLLENHRILPLLQPPAPPRRIRLQRDAVLPQSAAGLRPPAPGPRLVSLDQLHPQPVAPVGLPKLVHPHNMRMLQVGHHLGFALEPPHGFQPAGEVVGQQLERIPPLQHPVLRLIHLPHPAPAQQADDAVLAKAALRVK